MVYNEHQVQLHAQTKETGCDLSNITQTKGNFTLLNIGINV